jgi:hypothetical protein
MIEKMLLSIFIVGGLNTNQHLNTNNGGESAASRS